MPFSAIDGPGNRYVVFLQGCGFDCLACHAPGLIRVRPSGMPTTSVAQVLDGLRADAPFLTGVTVTGGEPTMQAQFVHELFAAVGTDPTVAGLTRFVDSNGDADPRTWQHLAPVTDGVMLDLKALDDRVHRVATDAFGEFRVLGLEPGRRYRVEIAAAGYRNWVAIVATDGDRDLGDIALARP